MPDGFHIASAYVTVDPDTDGFPEKLKAQLERYDFNLKIPVSPDVPADFMAQAEAQIRAQRGDGVNVPVTPDAGGFGEKLQAAVDAGEAGVKGHPVDVPIDPAPGFDAKLGEAIAQARVFVTGTGGVTVPVNYDVNTAGIARMLAINSALRGTTDTTNALTAATRTAGTAAGNTFRIWGTGIRIGATAMHALVSGTIELAAVLIPATVAAGAWAAVWAQGAQNVGQHMESVYTATEATANMFHVTAGQAVGLGNALQTAQDKANPDVYQALGAAVTVVKEHFGNLAQTGLQVGQVFDTFAAKVVYDMSSAGGAGDRLNSLLSAMVPDLTQLGQIFGNLGHALLNFSSDMPGAANMLLSFLDAVSKVIEEISTLPKWLIEGAFALHELNTWGSVAVGGLNKLGLATTTLSGNFIGFGRAAGILKNVLGIVPQLAVRAGEGFAAAGGAVGRFGYEAETAANKSTLFGRVTGSLGGALGGFGAKTAAAGEATAGLGVDAGVATAGLSTLATFGIAAAVAGLGGLVYWMATARSSAENFASGLEQAAQKASDLSVVNVLAVGMGKLQQATDQTQTSMKGLAKQGALTGGGLQSYGRFATQAQIAQTNLTDSYTQGVRDSAAYRGAQEQLGREFVNVGTGAVSLARTYHTTLAGAMALAQGAGVSLTQSIQGNGEAATLARIKIADLVQGYKSMGQPAGEVGADMTAIAIQSGLAATQVGKLNSAWDSFMSNLTGGTSGLAGFEQALTQLTTGSNNVTTILGKTKSVTLSMQDFAGSLKKFTGAGAQAWQNFDQVVGGTAPQLIDWLRTAGAEGAISGTQFSRGVADMVAQLVPLAADSKTAQHEVIGLAQQGNASITTWAQVKSWLDKTGTSTGNLASIIGQATANMGNMSQVAQKLGTVMQSAIINMMSQATLEASGAQKAMVAYASAVENNTQNTAAGRGARQQLITDLVHAGLSASQATGYVKTLAGNIKGLPTQHNTKLTVDNSQARAGVTQAQDWIDGLHGKTININVAIATSGSVPSSIGLGVRTGATGGVIPGYAPGVDSVPAVLSPGEGVLVPEAVRGIGGADAVHALNRKFGGARVARGNKTGGFAAGGVTSQAKFTYPNDQFIINIALPPGSPHTIPGPATGTLPSTLTAAQEKAAEKAGKRLADDFAAPWLKTAAAIRNYTKQAVAEIDKYYKGPEAARLTAAIKSQSAAMQQMATKASALQATMTAMKAYAANITSSLASSTGLGAITAPVNAAGNPVPITGSYIKQQLQKQLSTLQQFFNAINRLNKDKLGKTLIAQVIALGPDAGLQYANAILAGGSGLAKQLATIEAEIGKTETKIGQEAADIQYGQSTAKGFLSGLKAQQSQLFTEMHKLGDEIAKELAKDLGVPLKDIKLGKPVSTGHGREPAKGKPDPHAPKKARHPADAVVVQHFHGVQNLTPQQLRQIKTEMSLALAHAG